jgi:hypothetical protein
MFDFEKETLKDFQDTEEFIHDYIGPHKLKAKHWFDYITKYVKSTKLSYNQYNRFLVYRKKSDEIWKQDFNDYFQNYQIENKELVRVK